MRWMNSQKSETKKTLKTKSPHRGGDSVRLYEAGSTTEKSRKIEKLFNDTFPELVKGKILSSYKDYRILENGDIYSMYQCSVIKPAETKDGYLQISIKNNDGKYKTELVHRLVAKAYIGEPSNSEERITVNHKDGNKKNNAVENLEFITHSKNLYHAVETGLYKTKMRKCLVSQNNIDWIEFKSFEDARKYIENKTNKKTHSSQIREVVVKNMTIENNRGTSVEYNPFRCRGYVVKYKDELDKVEYNKNNMV